MMTPSQNTIIQLFFKRRFFSKQSFEKVYILQTHFLIICIFNILCAIQIVFLFSKRHQTNFKPTWLVKQKLNDKKVLRKRKTIIIP